MNPHICEPRL